MDPGDAEPDREQLESRVEELEATVSKMLPGRRGVLKGLGAAALGGAAVGGATGGASGQSAAGQVGTEDSPVDVEAADVAAQSVSTDDAIVNTRLEATELDHGSPQSSVQPLSFGSGESLTAIEASTTTVTGDNTQTAIYNPSDPPSTGLMVVCGRDPDFGATFVDLLLVARFTEQTLINAVTRDGPGPRSYNNNGTIQTVAIDDTGVDYEVSVWFIGGLT